MGIGEIKMLDFEQASMVFQLKNGIWRIEKSRFNVYKVGQYVTEADVVHYLNSDHKVAICNHNRLILEKNF